MLTPFRGDLTFVEAVPAMAVSQIYSPGELGIKHEGTVAVTESGCENLGPKWSGTPEEPAAA